MAARRGEPSSLSQNKLLHCYHGWYIYTYPFVSSSLRRLPRGKQVGSLVFFSKPFRLSWMLRSRKDCRIFGGCGLDSLHLLDCSLAILDWWLTEKQLKISRRHMGPISKANLRPRRTKGSVELEQEMNWYYVSYTAMINSLLAKI